MAERVDVTDPDDPRLTDYRDLRDVGSPQAPRGRARSLPRRGREGRAPRRRGRLPGSLVPDGATVARGPGRRARREQRSLLRPVGAADRAGDRVPRAPGRPGVPAPPAAAAARGGARGRPLGAGAGGHRRPHQRRCDLPLGRRSRLRRGAARPAVRRPSLPALDQGRHGRGLQHAVDPPARLVRRPPDLSRRGFTTVALTLSPDSVPIEAAVDGVDRLALVLGSEGTACPRAGRPLPTAGRSSRCGPASTRSTSPPPPPWPATPRRAAEDYPRARCRNRRATTATSATARST